MEYFEWDLPVQTKHKTREKLYFFEYSDCKRYYPEPDMVEYEKSSRPQYDLILGTETMKELGIVLDVKAKTITIDEIILPMRNISALKLNNSLAMEPKSTQDATKHETGILDTKYKEADLQSIVEESCKHLTADQQKKLLQLLMKYKLLFDGTLGDWRTKLVSFELREGISLYHG
jgi:hypothetical protein